MTEARTLEELHGQPFELLRELERRSRAAIAGQTEAPGSDEEWVGVGFRIGSETFVAPREQVREVLMVPESITPVPGAKRWVVGLANVRGQLLPLIDLKMFLGGGRTGTARGARLVSVHHREVPAGLLVDEVTGFRRFMTGEYSEDWSPTILRCDQYLAGAFRHGPDSWPVFDLHRLVESPPFLQAAAE
jgi:twitching motility protein PilI